MLKCTCGQVLVLPSQHLVYPAANDDFVKGLIAIHGNLIISTVSLSKHDKTLKNISERAKDHNIKFNLKKIQLRVPKVKACFRYFL